MPLTVTTVNSHNNFFVFTGALIFLLLASAIVASSPEGENHRLMQAVMALTELVAFFSLNLSRRWRRFVVAMLLMLLLVNGLREFGDWPATPLLGLVASLLFFCGMAYAAARQVLFTGGIDLNTIIGTLAVYLLLGLIWALLYLIALEFWPYGINGISYKNWNDNFSVTAYFSFITMTTVGYGDMSPAVPVTRTLAYLQAMCGSFYVAVVVASLVSSFGKDKN